MRRGACATSVLLAMCWTTSLQAQTRTGTIRGHVTDAATQQPLSGVTVTVGSRGALTQTDGRFVLSGVPAGSDSVRARLIGYAPASQVVSLAGGDTVTADFLLTP